MEEMVKVFSNVEFGEVRVVVDGEKMLFCGADVARALGYSNPNKAVNDHCRAITKCSTPISGKIQEVNFITEGDIYRLIARSKLPSAEKFESWVFDEVLPTIRKTGGYVNNDSQFIETYLPNADEATKVMFKAQLEVVKSLNRKVAEQTQQIAELQPKATYYDIVLQSENSVPITLIAKDYGMSAAKMNALLASFGVQYKMHGTWLLYSKYQDFGYTKSKTYTYADKRGMQVSQFNTNWTQKGRLFIYDLLKKNGILPVIEKDNAA